MQIIEKMNGNQGSKCIWPHIELQIRSINLSSLKNDHRNALACTYWPISIKKKFNFESGPINDLISHLRTQLEVLPSILNGCPWVILITFSGGDVVMIVILKSNLGSSELVLKFGRFMECNNNEPFHFQLWAH